MKNIIELTEKFQYLNNERMNVISEINREFEKQAREQENQLISNEFAPDCMLIVTKFEGWNPLCIEAYNKHILGLKQAYYTNENLPKKAKDNVIEYLQAINNEPDFIYFFDTLLAKICSNHNL